MIGAADADDLLRALTGTLDGSAREAVVGQSDGVYGIAWRRPDQQPLGPSAAGNVATVVKAYYLALPAPEKVSAELAEGLSLAGGVGALRRSRGRVAANPLAAHRVPGIRWFAASEKPRLSSVGRC